MLEQSMLKKAKKVALRMRTLRVPYLTKAIWKEPMPKGRFLLVLRQLRVHSNLKWDSLRKSKARSQAAHPFMRDMKYPSRRLEPISWKKIVPSFLK